MRIGNAATEQFQLDVYGEVIDALYQARVARPREGAARVGAAEARCSTTSRRAGDEPDEGIWEIRGERAALHPLEGDGWVAFDRAVQSVEEFGLDGPVERLARGPRRRSTREVCDRASTTSADSFTQSYGSTSSTRACC